jgi:hypothetical protein
MRWTLGGKFELPTWFITMTIIHCNIDKHFLRDLLVLNYECFKREP